MFQPNTLYYTDAYKIGHKPMLAPSTIRLYGTEIPRSVKYAPKGVTKIVNFGKQLAWMWLHDQYQENFFKQPVEDALQFSKDMSMLLGLEYNGDHFVKLHELGYLPIRVHALPEGIETLPNVPHSDFINTVDGFAWLTLYLETIVSSLCWKSEVAATVALKYRRTTTEWVAKTDKDRMFLVDYLCHDFSARGLNPHDQLSVGLGHATSFRGSDTLIAIPAARYYYGEPKTEVIINSVNASEHSVSCTNIFYYKDLLEKGKLNDRIKEYYDYDLPCDGSVEEPDYLAIAEWLMLESWLEKFPEAILSYVCDTFNTWKSVTHIVARLKIKIMARNGKLVLRPDSGDPADIICGFTRPAELYRNPIDARKFRASEEECKGVIELLWDIFGGTINDQGYKVLDSHIGAIYGDSINHERQLDIYERLDVKGFACTNIVLGVGSFTYAYNTRDTIGMAIKGAWFEVDIDGTKTGFDIYKDPITDDGTKKSLKGFQFVYQDEAGEYRVESQVTEEKHNSSENLLRPIYIDGKFYNEQTFTQIRESLLNIEAAKSAQLV